MFEWVELFFWFLVVIGIFVILGLALLKWALHFGEAVAKVQAEANKRALKEALIEAYKEIKQA